MSGEGVGGNAQAELEAAELKQLLKNALYYLEDHYDLGPNDGGFQSKDLEALIYQIRESLQG